jgi:hypothetical protein
MSGVESSQSSGERALWWTVGGPAEAKAGVEASCIANRALDDPAECLNGNL